MSFREKGEIRQMITFNILSERTGKPQKKGKGGEGRTVWYEIVWNEKWNQELKIELHFLFGNTQETLSALHKFYYCCSKWYYHKSH